MCEQTRQCDVDSLADWEKNVHMRQNIVHSFKNMVHCAHRLSVCIEKWAFCREETVFREDLERGYSHIFSIPTNNASSGHNHARRYIKCTLCAHAGTLSILVMCARMYIVHTFYVCLHVCIRKYIIISNHVYLQTRTYTNIAQNQI